MLISIILAGCSSSENGLPDMTANPETGRWYSTNQVDQGKTVFQENCSICHKSNAEGTEDWKTPGQNGQLPPPPLNGTAHAWHHPIAVLTQVIAEGGIPLGGSMPGFDSQLNDSEKLQAIAFFQSYWPDNVYQQWVIREEAYRSRLKKDTGGNVSY